METPAPVKPTGPKGRRRKGAGRTDYLLCVQVGDMPKALPVGVLEAKKETEDPLKGMQQAKGYADCQRFEVKYVFATNGHLYGEFDFFTNLLWRLGQAGQLPKPALFLCDRDELREQAYTKLKAAFERINPTNAPDDEVWYVDISSIDSLLKNISTPTRTKGKAASVRARQLIRTNDVLVSTTRPNLNAVALVPNEYDGQICSTGFCVLRCGDHLDCDYLFHFVRSGLFINSLSSLVQGALYPAVTDKQVFAQSIPWVPIEKQRQIAARLKAQLAEVDKARQAIASQINDINLLPQKILAQAFGEAQP